MNDPGLRSTAVANPPSSAGRLLALLAAVIYGVFTLLPNGHSLMVTWPWVFIWQMMLLLLVLWALWQIGQEKQFTPLGLGFDWLALLAVLVVVVSSFGSAHPQQARWYSWMFFAFLGGLYGLRTWLARRPQPLLALQALLAFQGYLGVAFILISLVGWWAQTLMPFWQRAAVLQSAGVTLTFSFSELMLRNWAPIGHQNYVAGYLVLILPLLLLLAWQAEGKRRWFWLASFVVGLGDFYTTSSRGGLLGLGTLVLLGVLGLGLQSQLSNRWRWGISLGALAGLGVIILTNDRLTSTVLSMLPGNSGSALGLGYRVINSVVGWRMGSDHWFTGIGLGNVVLQYQRYRPFWAGRESELAYQLHSTPMQLFAELGIGGWIVPSILSVGLGWQGIRQLRKTASPEVRRWQWGLGSALIAYGVVSLTDYQLDVIPINGLLVIYLACLLQLWQLKPAPSLIHPWARPTFAAGIGLTAVICLWLYPWLRAWQLSEISFRALNAEKIPAFTTYLTRASHSASWEPVYRQKLGWNLGNLAVTELPFPETAPRIEAAITELEKAVEISPDQEFSYNALGWLQLRSRPSAASQSFTQGLELVPAKRGLFYGLGLSLLAQNQAPLAIEAFTLECLRNPLFLTNPIWRDRRFAPLYPAVIEATQTGLQQLLDQAVHDPDWQQQLTQIQGAIHWWLGQFSQAEAVWSQGSVALSETVLTLSQTPEQLSNLEPTLADPLQSLVKAWLTPAQRPQLLTRAWLIAQQAPIPDTILQQCLATMEAAPSFYDWLTEMPPVLQFRRTREGFGVNRRQLEGPAPQDFYVVIENLPITVWFDALFPTPILTPAWDRALQPRREQLWQQVSALNSSETSPD